MQSNCSAYFCFNTSFPISVRTTVGFTQFTRIYFKYKNTFLVLQQGI